MSLKFFTNQFKGNASASIAINPRYVISVFESTVEGNTITTIYSAGTTFQVEDNYLDVVARLNEPD